MAAIIRYLGYDPTSECDSPADRLRALRRRRGLTQREVAAQLGLDEGTVVDLERGRRRVSRRVAEAVEDLRDE
jgi:transcriptional regulator with XRE-family HTH domain